ncbi:hypothetical protein E2562_033212 [Oryza meyeriana var. granulata]|uniref:Uncharacterized protein n=1 Tax=Oryza meyeriana var. granulata TaxID=110450 RepID=A0A6G1BPX9_9ORYZ|nr:hypothetical protein E2562_033212 [Oryza meyeriana var. granulata]
MTCLTGLPIRFFKQYQVMPSRKTSRPAKMEDATLDCAFYKLIVMAADLQRWSFSPDLLINSSN